MTRSWMWMIVSMVAAGAPVLAAPVPAAPKADEKGEAAPGASERLGQSYVLMTRAEQAWKAGDPAKASAAYGDALEILESVEVDYPGWASHIVRSRILGCESAIEKIRDGKPCEAAAAASPAEGGPSNAMPDVSFALSASSVETAMKALKAGIVERDAALADLRAELLALKKENTALRGRLAKLEGKPAGGEAQAIPSILKSQARQLLAAGAYSNAVTLLVEMKGMYPDEAGVSHLLGITYCRLGAFPDAVRELEPSVKHGRAPAEVWQTLGVAYMGTGDLGRGRQAFEEALELDGNLSEAHFNLAQILIRLKKPDPDLARRHYMLSLQLGATRDSDLEMAINTLLLNEQVRKLKK